jgi:ATP-dependent Lhr-like helicase
MLTANWSGLSVLYLCPIKALLNNLESRLGHYLGLVGRRVGVWHGDVSSSVKRRILAEPPDLLLTTPESLEGMLISRKVEHVPLLGGVRAVIVDELHAFAGDDRGWHVRGVLTRLKELGPSCCEIIGLSATVGNPDALITWLTLDSRAVCVGERARSQDADIEIDYVGSTPNAATVIARLHSGEKRLVFCDSRSQVEMLAQELHRLGMRVFVSHSSLSADARRQAERAFAQERDCVIVATSTLELGIDVGDLDRVVQIDAPRSVSSFLQRMGRSGRRTDSRRNCLFLATGAEDFLIACAITNLWRRGFVEDVTPPAQPWHVALQQVLALLLEHGALSASDVTAKLVKAFPELASPKLELLLEHLQSTSILSSQEGLLYFGPEGERQFGRRNFLDLTSVFVSSPDFVVLHGRTELGYVAPAVLLSRGAEPITLSLAGQGWHVTSVDWRRKQAWVERQESAAPTHWGARARPLAYSLVQTVREILRQAEPGVRLTRRAVECLETQRNQFAFLGDADRVVATQEGPGIRLWTFAGLQANLALAQALRQEGIAARSVNDFGITTGATTIDALTASLRKLSGGFDQSTVTIPNLDDVKFANALPVSLRQEVAVNRLFDVSAARAICSMPVVLVRDMG